MELHYFAKHSKNCIVYLVTIPKNKCCLRSKGSKAGRVMLEGLAVDP